MPQLRDGQAEVFGTELQTGETLLLKGQKFAVGTWLALLTYPDCKAI